MMTTEDTPKYIVIHDISEIPNDMTEDEEHEFWKTHTIASHLWQRVGPDDQEDLPPARPRRKNPPVRLP